MGKAAKGSLLKIGDGAATETFTTIFEVRDITAAGMTVDQADCTHQTSPLEEVAVTVLRTEEVTFQVNYNPRNATHSSAASGLKGDLEDRTDRNFQLVVPAATSTAGDQVAFNGYVVGLSPSYAIGDAEVADVTVKPHKTLFVWTTTASVA